MKLSYAVFCCLGALAAAAAAETSASSIPLFKWAGNSQVDVGASDSTAQGALSALLAGHKDAEMVMVYLLHEVSSKALHGKSAALTNFQDVLAKADSSSFSNIALKAQGSDDLHKAAREAGASAVAVPSSELQAFLAKNAGLAANKKQDVVVVTFPEGADIAEADALVGAAEKAVASSTNGAHAGLLSSTLSEKTVATNLAFQFTGSNSATSKYYSAPSAFNVWTRTGATNLIPPGTTNAGYTSNQGGKGLKYGPSVYLTPTLLLAIIVTLYMLFVSISAFCCILSLQTPEMFEGDQLKLMKEALDKQGNGP